MRLPAFCLFLSTAATLAMAQSSPTLHSGYVVLRPASAGPTFYDGDQPTSNPDYTNTVTYLYAGEPLYLGGEVTSPRYSCNAGEGAVDQATLYYSVNGGPTNSLNLPKIANSPDIWQQATSTGMPDIAHGWAVGSYTVAVYFVGVDVNHCVAPGTSARLPASGAFSATVEVRAGAPDVLACDDASQRPYWDGWGNGDNGGHGFGPWTTLVSTVNSGDAAGFFLATNSANLDLLYAATRGRAWGLYANEGSSGANPDQPQIAGAFRALPGPLQVGQTFLIDFEHGGIRFGSLTEDNFPRNGGWVGFGLRAQMPVLQFDPDPISPFGSMQNNGLMVGFRGGDLNYTVWDTQSTSGRDTGLPYTTNGVRAEVTVTGPGAFRLRLSSLAPGGGSVTLDGVHSGDLSVAGIFNRNAELNDAFFNRMWVLGAPLAARAAADDAADAAYGGGWTNQSNGGFGFQPWLVSANPGPGLAGYFLATNPPNTDLNAIASLGRAWGSYAKDGGGGGVQVVAAYRYFGTQPLQPGQTIGASIEHGGISSLNGEVELMVLVPTRFGNLQGEGLGFRFSGGASAYGISDNNAIFSTEVPYTDGGLRYDLKLMRGGSPGLYALTVDARALNNGVFRYCGEIEAAPIGLRFRITDVENDDVFLNRLYLTGAPSDPDADGMPTDWENANGLNSATNDAAGDLDGDGQLNIEEFVAFTPPNASNSFFRAQAVDVGDRAGVSIPSVTGRLYTLEARDDLLLGDWFLVGQTDRPGTGSPLVLTNGISPNQFFRVRVRMAP